MCPSASRDFTLSCSPFVQPESTARGFWAGHCEGCVKIPNIPKGIFRLYPTKRFSIRAEQGVCTPGGPSAVAAVSGNSGIPDPVPGQVLTAQPVTVMTNLTAQGGCGAGGCQSLAEITSPLCSTRQIEPDPRASSPFFTGCCRSLPGEMIFNVLLNGMRQQKPE